MQATGNRQKKDKTAGRATMAKRHSVLEGRLENIWGNLADENAVVVWG